MKPRQLEILQHGLEWTNTVAARCTVTTFALAATMKLHAANSWL